MNRLVLLLALPWVITTSSRTVTYYNDVGKPTDRKYTIYTANYKDTPIIGLEQKEAIEDFVFGMNDAHRRRTAPPIPREEWSPPGSSDYPNAVDFEEIRKQMQPL